MDIVWMHSFAGRIKCDLLEIPRFPIRFGDVVKVKVLKTTGACAKGEVIERRWGLSIRNK